MGGGEAAEDEEEECPDQDEEEEEEEDYRPGGGVLGTGIEDEGLVLRLVLDAGVGAAYLQRNFQLRL